MHFKNVLSLFDGASCGQLALKKVGIKYENYFASEIEIEPMLVSSQNFPNTKYLGDVTKIDGKKLSNIDLMIFGSPCGDLSGMGKQQGMSTKDGIKITNLKQYLKLKKEGKEFVGQSFLFWEAVRLMRETKAKYFLMENTKMPKQWEELITKELKVKPIYINSSLVSAQNRERIYWTNIPNVSVPKDKNILLKDIIKDAVSVGVRGRKVKGVKKYVPTLTKRTDGKANCVVTSPHSTNLVEIKGEIRKISVEEAEMLQTWPKGYTNVRGLTKSAKYKMIGNGWTVDVISHIFKSLKKVNS